MKDLKGTKVLVRGDKSGVFLGTLVSRQGSEVELENVRNIWRWEGAFSLIELANNGVSQINGNRYSENIESLQILDAIEILPVSEKADSVLMEIEPWKI